MAYKLSKMELTKMNQGLRDLAAIKDDIKRAQNAGVPGMDSLLEGCNACQEAIEKLKAQFAGDKK